MILYSTAGRPGNSEVPRNPLTRWDVSSIPANGIFLTKKLQNKNKNAQRMENDKIVSTQNSTSRSTRESCVTPACTSNELDVQNEWEEDTHTHSILVYISLFTQGPIPVCLGGTIIDSSSTILVTMYYCGYVGV